MPVIFFKGCGMSLLLVVIDLKAKPRTNVKANAGTNIIFFIVVTILILPDQYLGLWLTWGYSDGGDFRVLSIFRTDSYINYWPLVTSRIKN